MWTETDVKKVLEIMNSLVESCGQIIKAFSDWAEEVRTALDRVFNNSELYPDAHGTPPKIRMVSPQVPSPDVRTLPLHPDSSPESALHEAGVLTNRHDFAPALSKLE